MIPPPHTHTQYIPCLSNNMHSMNPHIAQLLATHAIPDTWILSCSVDFTKNIELPNIIVKWILYTDDTSIQQHMNAATLCWDIQ